MQAVLLALVLLLVALVLLFRVLEEVALPAVETPPRAEISRHL